MASEELHLIDAHLFMGNLLSIVRDHTAAYLRHKRCVGNATMSRSAPSAPGAALRERRTEVRWLRSCAGPAHGSRTVLIDTSGYQLAIREQRARARKSGRSVVPWRHAYCKGGVITNEPKEPRVRSTHRIPARRDLRRQER